MDAILQVVGAVLCLAGGLGIIILAFRESVIWGIATLIIPFANLIFVFMYFGDTKKPFFMALIGIVLFVVGGGTAAPA